MIMSNVLQFHESDCFEETTLGEALLLALNCASVQPGTAHHGIAESAVPHGSDVTLINFSMPERYVTLAWFQRLLIGSITQLVRVWC